MHDYIEQKYTKQQQKDRKILFDKIKSKNIKNSSNLIYRDYEGNQGSKKNKLDLSRLDEVKEGQEPIGLIKISYQSH